MNSAQVSFWLLLLPVVHQDVLGNNISSVVVFTNSYNDSSVTESITTEITSVEPQTLSVTIGKQYTEGTTISLTDVSQNSVSNTSDESTLCANELNESVCSVTSPEKQGLVSKEAFDVIKIVTYCVLYICHIAGIFLNILNILVYKSPSFSAVGKSYIIGLSFIDILANTIGFSIVVLVTLAPTTLDIIRISLNFISISFRRLSNCVICCMSLERCITLLRPLQTNKNNIMARHPLVIMAIAFVTVFLIGWVDIAKFKEENAKKAKTIVALFSKIAFGYVTLGLTMVFNCVTLLYLQRQSKIRRTLSASVTESEERKKQAAITRLILTMTFVYVLLALPNTAVLIVRDVIPSISPWGKERLLYLTLIRTGTCTDTLMNISDVFVFLVLNKKYRSRASSLVRQCFCFACKSHFDGKSYSDNTNERSASETKVSVVSQTA